MLTDFHGRANHSFALWEQCISSKAWALSVVPHFSLSPPRVAFSRVGWFTHPRVLLALLSLRKHGGLLVVYSTYEMKMAACNRKRSISMVLRKYGGLWKAYCYISDSVSPWGVEWEQKHLLATDSHKVYSTTPINSLFQTCRLYNEKYTNSWLFLLHYTPTTVHSKRVPCDCAANRIIRIIHTMKNKVHLLPFLLFSS